MAPHPQRAPAIGLLAAALLFPLAPGSTPTAATGREALFQDRLFQQCINWMLDGVGGAMIENQCIDYYALPPPSLFMCARKVFTGFPSANDQEVCAVIFEDQAAKVRAGYIR
ncbi:MAG: hypothetical protein KF723_04285 [Rhizobiaceae bacterium]|nr:hypothetical protein [Rhizobiaceae bacterium]